MWPARAPGAGGPELSLGRVARTLQQPVRSGAQDFDIGEGWRVLPVAQAFHTRTQHPEQPLFLGRVLREN